MLLLAQGAALPVASDGRSLAYYLMGLIEFIK